jgi:Uma2 family endonuclease
MAGQIRIPIEVYLQSSYEPDAEYVNGAIEVRPAALWNHSSWQAAILQFFSLQREAWGIRARPSLRTRTSATTVRVPDVAILDRRLPKEQIITHPPIAVFEILSPEDSHSRLMIKLGEYERMGVRTIVVLDPETGNHRRYVEGRLEPLPAEPFDLPGSRCRFDLDEIVKLLD